MPARFLAALHEAGKVSSREDGRFALSRVQVRGRAGQVVATDGKTALVFGGFNFPFAEDVLVPAVPLFGCPELRDEADVRVGRTQAHLVVSAGPWTVWLSVARGGKFPDVASVIPRHPPTTAGVDERDAAELLALLPSLPGAAHEHRPVTIEASGMVKVRARDECTGQSKEVTLIRSPAAGPPARVTVDRRVLGRALALGCRALRLTPEKPLVAEGEGITLLAAPLEPALAVGPSDDMTRVSTDRGHSDNATANTNPPRTSDMRPHGTNSHAFNGGRHEPPPTSDPPDPLAAAEELRAALAEVTAKAARLVAALKAGRKEKKTLASVWAGLKQLNFGNGGRS